MNENSKLCSLRSQSKGFCALNGTRSSEIQMKTCFEGYQGDRNKGVSKGFSSEHLIARHTGQVCRLSKDILASLQGMSVLKQKIKKYKEEIVMQVKERKETNMSWWKCPYCESNSEVLQKTALTTIEYGLPMYLCRNCGKLSVLVKVEQIDRRKTISGSALVETKPSDYGIETEKV